ncbi:uncharacterized protein LOC113527334 [Tachysurus ichikawai]
MVQKNTRGAAVHQPTLKQYSTVERDPTAAKQPARENGGKGEEIQPSCIREIQLGIENLGYVEMQSGKKKENESCGTLEHLLEIESSNCLDISFDVDSRSPDSSLSAVRNHSATQQRFPPAPLNQSYDVESPSLTPLRTRIRSGSEASETFVRHNLEPGTHPYHSTNQEDVATVDVLQDKIEQQKAACLLTAAARGFLTRRLLQTEKIKHLNKTIQDSRQVIRAFQAEAHKSKASITKQKLQLQQRARAQRHAAVCEVHEIFFVWPVRDRIALLQQVQKLHSERRVEKMVRHRTGTKI